MIDNSIIEALTPIWWALLVISFFISVVSFFWGILDLIVLMRFDGKIKRGVKIWSKPLPLGVRLYLSSLDKAVIEKRKIWFFEREIGFIRVENNEALVRYQRPNWSTSWPYVAYIDIVSPEPVLQFRSSLPMHLFLLPFIISIVGVPFVFLIMLVNYHMESTAIENFLKQKISESKQ